MSNGQLNGVIRRMHKLAGLHELGAFSDGQLMERFVKIGMSTPLNYC